MKRILFVIDYQNDFVNGSLGFQGAEELDEKIVEKILEYGKGNVFFTRDTHGEDYLETREGKNLPIIHCIKNTYGWDIYGKTKKALEEVEAVGFDKQVFGLKIDHEVASMLPDHVDEIEFVGLVSNICVISNVVILQAYYPNATMVVDSSLTASADQTLNQEVLNVMRGLQVKVL